MEELDSAEETPRAIIIDEVELVLEEEANLKKAKTTLTCSQCPSVFTSRTKLSDHMLKHSGSRPFKCNLCDKSYPLKGIYIIATI